MSSNPLEELFASTPEDLAGTEPDENSTGNQQQLTAIGPFLRDLRGGRSLRQLQDRDWHRLLIPVGHRTRQ